MPRVLIQVSREARPPSGQASALPGLPGLKLFVMMVKTVLLQAGRDRGGKHERTSGASVQNKLTIKTMLYSFPVQILPCYEYYRPDFAIKKIKKIESNRITSLGSVLGPELVMLVINSAVFLNCSPYSPMTASFL